METKSNIATATAAARQNRILVVDDEIDICEVLQFNLEHEGFYVETAHSAEEALTKIPAGFHLLLLDVMMEGISGFQLAQKVRARGDQTPIIFLTAKDTENDMLTGFSVGADDYVSKPFSVKEIIVRIKAVLKRGSGSHKETPDSIKENSIRIDDMEINLDSKQIHLDGNKIMLTKREFEILVLLVRNPGRIYSREDILEKVWKEDRFVLDRTVDVHITRLRKKLGEYGAHIVNRTGYGYCFD